MESCYVILIHDVVNCIRESTTLFGVAKTLPLAEKMIQNHYTGEFGEDGGTLRCELQPGYSDTRTYWCKGHEMDEEIINFTVSEEAIQNDMALL